MAPPHRSRVGVNRATWPLLVAALFLQSCAQQTATPQFEECLKGTRLLELSSGGVNEWLHCSTGHGLMFAAEGGDLASMTDEEISEVLSIPLEGAREVLRLLSQGSSSQRCRKESCGGGDAQLTGSRGLSSFYDGHDKVPDFEQRFSTYQATVCERCRESAVDCGCADAEEEGPFRLLQDYATMYEGWKAYPQDSKYVVVTLNAGAGIGNHMVALSYGLAVAIGMNRAFVVANSSLLVTDEWRDFVHDLDPVIDFLTEVPPTPVAQQVHLFMHKPETLQGFLCGDVSAMYEGFPVLHLQNAMHGPHILFNNPHFGNHLEAALLGRPIFFLSHFFWSGKVQDATRVTFESFPERMRWDGHKSVAEFASQLRKGRDVAHIVGIHVRTSAVKKHDRAPYFLPFDHTSVLEDSSMPLDEKLDAYCDGHRASLRPFSDCFLELLAELRGNSTGRVVVLWAVDVHELSQDLFQNLTEVGGVTVVRIRHSAPLTHHTQASEGLPPNRLQSGMVDLHLLTLSQTLLGSLGSTFSITAHARGLARPLYSGFVEGGRTACARSGGSEAGFFTTGKGYDECSHRGMFDVQCRAVSDTCAALLVHAWEMGTCVQNLAPCWGGDAGWLDPYSIGIDNVRWTQNWIMRYRGTLVLPATTGQHYPKCYPEPHW